MEAFLQRARENYDRVMATPQNSAHLDQGAAMWRKAFEDEGLPLDPTTARVCIFALGLAGARAQNFLEGGEMVNWACAEASTYLVPALGGEGSDLEDIALLDPDVEWEWIESKVNWTQVVRDAGLVLFGVTGAILAWRERRG